MITSRAEELQSVIEWLQDTYPNNSHVHSGDDLDVGAIVASLRAGEHNRPRRLFNP